MKDILRGKRCNSFPMTLILWSVLLCSNLPGAGENHHFFSSMSIHYTMHTEKEGEVGNNRNVNAQMHSTSGILTCSNTVKDPSYINCLCLVRVTLLMVIESCLKRQTEGST